MKEVVEFGHVMEEEELVDVDRIACDNQLLWYDPHIYEIVDDLLFCLL
jgi:hypothetical protein